MRQQIAATGRQFYRRIISPPELGESIVRGKAARHFPVLRGRVILGADFLQAGRPFVKAVEVFRRMGLPGFHLQLDLCDALKLLVHFIRANVARLAFHQILQRADHPLDWLGAWQLSSGQTSGPATASQVPFPARKEDRRTHPL